MQTYWIVKEIYSIGRFFIALGGLLFLIFALPSYAVAEVKSKIKVAATIKPLHSLVALVTDGIVMPDMIIASGSPHNYQLRPSDIRKIDNAGLIFAISPSLETFLAHTKHVMFLDTITNKLPRRGMIVRDISSSYDPHIWLSPINAIKMLKSIADALSAMDPSNQHRYQANSENASRKINNWAEIFKKKLPIGDQKRKYVVFHDAFQYFEKEFGLDGAIVKNNHGMSIKELADLVTNNNEISCIIEEEISENLLPTYKKIVVRIDPLGKRLNPSKELYLDLLQEIAEGFSACLAAKDSA